MSKNDLKEANELFKKATAFYNDNKLQEAMSVLDELISRFERSDQPGIQIKVAMALANKNVILKDMLLPAEKIKTYDKLIALFEDSKNEKIQILVAKALLNKGVTFSHIQLLAKEINTYDKLINLFKDSMNEQIQLRVAMALVNKGLALSETLLTKEAINTYDTLIDWFRNSKNEKIQIQIAIALFNKGVILNKVQEKLKTYDNLINLFEDSKNEEVQLRVAKALINKGLTLNKSKEKINTYDKLITLFENSNNEKIQVSVAKALLNKGVTLDNMRLYNEEINTYDKLIDLFEDSHNEEIKNILKKSYLYKSYTLEENPRGHKWIKVVNCFEEYLKLEKLPWHEYLKEEIKGNKAYASLLSSLVSIRISCIDKIQTAKINEDEKPEKVCHFTSINALLAILGHKKNDNKDFDKEDKKQPDHLRAYNAVYMNDPSEGKALIEYSHRRSNDDKDIPDLTEFFKDEERCWIEHDAAKSVYSVSFTAEHDSLTLWRAYGRDGNGACIVIPTSAIPQSDDSITGKYYTTDSKSIENELKLSEKEQVSDKSSPEESEKNISTNLYKVQYISPDKKLNDKFDEKSTDDFLKSLNEQLKKIIDIRSKNNDSAELINTAVREAFSGALYLFKDAQYAPEKEYRMLDMLQLNDTGIHLDESFPPRLYMVTKPFVFRNKDTEVIIGPAVEDPEYARLAVEYNLRHNEHFSDEIKVSISKVKYRPAKKMSFPADPTGKSC